VFNDIWDPSELDRLLDTDVVDMRQESAISLCQRYCAYKSVTSVIRPTWRLFVVVLVCAAVTVLFGIGVRFICQKKFVTCLSRLQTHSSRHPPSLSSLHTVTGLCLRHQYLYSIWRTTVFWTLRSYFFVYEFISCVKHSNRSLIHTLVDITIGWHKDSEVA